MPSKVFFSSCFDDPKGSKLAIRKRIIDNINPHRHTGEPDEVENFPVWMAESWKQLDRDNGVPYLEKAMFCIDSVRSSDTYVAVVRENYGTGVTTKPGTDVQASYFELELFEAALLGKPACIFILEGRDGPGGRLEAPLNLLAPAFPGFDRTPRSEDYIFRSLQEMLEDLEWPKPPKRLRHLVASGPQVTDRLMSDRHVNYDPRREAPQISFLNGLADLHTARPNGTVVEDVLAQAAAEKHHQRKLALLWMAIRELMGAPPTKANDEFVPLWEEALAAWNSAGAWYGLHGHPYMGCLAALGSLSKIKAVRSGITTGPHGALASEYYSIAKHVHKSKYRRDALQMSLRHVEVECQKGEASGSLGLRGSIRYAVGDKEGAIEDYRRALHLRRSVEGAEQAVIGESMSELGFALVRNWRSREGLDLMERGLELMITGPTTGFVVRARRKLGRAYAINGAPRRALGELAAAYQVAVDHGMADQLGAIDRLAARIDSTLPILKVRRPIR